MSAFVIDAFELCREKGQLAGEFDFAELPRLAQECVDHFGKIHWSVQGKVDRRGHSVLNLSVSGVARLLCQRCLTSFEFQIKSDCAVALAENEVQADELDEILADESIEVIEGGEALNILQLIEDEALLMLPSSPKHESCVAHPLAEKEIATEKVSPFAVLKGLKQ